MRNFKNRILEIILSNELFSKHLTTFIIDVEESNFISKDNKAILSEDNKVFIGKDSGLETNKTFFVSNYTTEEIEETLTAIDEYK